MERFDLASRLDLEIADLLAAIAVLNADRNEGLRRQMKVITRACNAAGVRPVWLKGACDLLPERGPESGRMMLDLDFWVPDVADQRRTHDVLNNLGYSWEEMEPTHYSLEPDRHHYPPYLHPDEMARIELHRFVVSLENQPILPNDEAERNIEWLEWEGTRIGRLDPMFGMLCSFVQCTSGGTGEFEHGYIPLMKACDFVKRIHEDFGGQIPSAMIARLERAGWERTARQFFTLTELYFGLPNPLPADGRLVQAMERRILHPQVQFCIMNTRLLLSNRGLNLLRRPSRIPKAALRFLQSMQIVR